MHAAAVPHLQRRELGGGDRAGGARHRQRLPAPCSARATTGLMRTSQATRRSVGVGTTAPVHGSVAPARPSVRARSSTMTAR
jgi:hypothetical protein